MHTKFFVIFAGLLTINGIIAQSTQDILEKYPELKAPFFAIEELQKSLAENSAEKIIKQIPEESTKQAENEHEKAINARLKNEFINDETQTVALELAKKVEKTFKTCLEKGNSIQDCATLINVGYFDFHMKIILDSLKQNEFANGKVLSSLYVAKEKFNNYLKSTNNDENKSKS